jgi:RNAse (barnase) inhibitor barstar
MYPCPCCGYLTFDEPTGSYAICEICLWEDDGVQLRFPRMPGGANKPSLLEAQANVRSCGAHDPDFVPECRAPRASDSRDPGWRPLDPSVDEIEAWESWRLEGELNHLYYCRPDFWFRRDLSGTVEIELRDNPGPDQLHARLERVLGFPGYYGRNWNAFWDVVRDGRHLPRTVRLRGWTGFAEAQPREAALFEECLADYGREHPITVEKAE